MDSNQTNRLSLQHKGSHGVENIFTDEAMLLDTKINNIAKKALEILQKNHPKLKFKLEKSISKKEINAALHSLDKELGQIQFVDLYSGQWGRLESKSHS